MRLLLVEDEHRMAQALCAVLKNAGYEVDHFSDGEEGLIALETAIYDLAILDVMLPGKNGYEIAKSARNQGIRTSILMLTAKSELEDKVKGLDCGADDYLTKPFMTEELLARLRALSRRGSAVLDSSELKFGDITLKKDSLMLTCDKEHVRLSEKEMHILEYLIINQGQVLTREQLAVKIWGYDSNAEYNNVEVYMSFVRKKLNFIHAKTQIKAVRGVGYELRYVNV